MTKIHLTLFRQFSVLLLLLLSVHSCAQKKITGFGSLALNETTIEQAKSILTSINSHGQGYDYVDENSADTNLIEMNGNYDEFGICVSLNFYKDTLYKIEVGTGCYTLDDNNDKKNDTGDFFKAFVMGYGGGKLSVTSKNVQCRCQYCLKPSTFRDYDSVRLWQNGSIHTKMQIKMVNFYAEGGCQQTYARSLVIQDLLVFEKIKKYLKAKEQKETEIHENKTKKMYKKL